MPGKCMQPNCEAPASDQYGQCEDHAYSLWITEDTPSRNVDEPTDGKRVFAV